MEKCREIIRIVPYKTKDKRDQVITTRFTESEKAKIDKIIEEYGVTTTDLLRNATLYYIQMLKEKDNVNFNGKD